jgi:small subunit ribosomal protein S4
VPDWLDVDAVKMTGRVKAMPLREQIDVPVREHLIVELYSR